MLSRSLVCTLVVFYFPITQAADEQTNVLVARCRSNCLNKFLGVNEPESCFGNSECWMCWDTCNLFYTNYKVWGNMCSDKKICFPGCQESCKFHETAKADDRHRDSSNHEKLRFSFEHSLDAIRLDWKRPFNSQPLVYLVEMKDRLNWRWEQIEQTLFTNSTIRRGPLRSSLAIRLSAINDRGTIAQAEISTSDLTSDESDTESFDEMSLDEHYSTQNDLRHSSDLYKSWEPTLLSLTNNTTHNDHMNALVSWPRIGDPSYRFEIEWKPETVGFDVFGRISTMDTMTTVPLWPNYSYRIIVWAFARGSRRPIAHSRQLIVDTRRESGVTLSEADGTQCTSNVVLLVDILVLLVSLSFVLVSIGFMLRARRNHKQQQPLPI